MNEMRRRQQRPHRYGYIVLRLMMAGMASLFIGRSSQRYCCTGFSSSSSMTTRTRTTTITTPTSSSVSSSSSALLSSASLPSLSDDTTASSLVSDVIIVLGGSGFIGRRVCQELVHQATTATTHVISVSRSGKPPVYYLNEEEEEQHRSRTGNTTWYNTVEWIQHDLLAHHEDDTPTTNDTDNNNNNNDTDIDVVSTTEASSLSLLDKITQAIRRSSSSSSSTNHIDITVIGCIGDLNPSSSWMGLWGLGYNNARLYRDNGVVYQYFVEKTLVPLLKNREAALGQHQKLRLGRCVLLSIDYTSSKCLEGPIDGYVNGKRYAEHVFVETLAAAQAANEIEAMNTSTDDNTAAAPLRAALENVVVIGLSSFVYGGNRFPTFGPIYRKLVESPLAKGYVKSNQALRSIGYDAEDWVEEMLFSSPIDVSSVGKITAMAAIKTTKKTDEDADETKDVGASSSGNNNNIESLSSAYVLTRKDVNNGQPRKQGFFNETGQPVLYDDIVFIDGTDEIETLLNIRKNTNTRKMKKPTQQKQKPSKLSSSSLSSPKWEGALIGKRPYLFPVPILIVFGIFFWAVVTEQFVVGPISPTDTTTTPTATTLVSTTRMSPPAESSTPDSIAAAAAAAIDGIGGIVEGATGSVVTTPTTITAATVDKMKAAVDAAAASDTTTAHLLPTFGKNII